MLKTAMYLLAGLALVVGMVAGASLLVSANRTANNLLLPLQLLGGGTFFNLLYPVISSFLKNLGVVTLILFLTFSALFYAAGRLISHILGLEARLARLEASSERT